MPSKKPLLMTYTEQTIIDKFKEIAKAENRSMSKELEWIVIQKINEYEQEHGTITLPTQKEPGDA